MTDKDITERGAGDRSRLRHRAGRRWRLGERIGRWWRNAQWPALGFLGLLALVLGFWGFHAYQRAVDAPAGFWDVLYLDLQLFPLQSGALLEAGVPWQLEVARFLAPLVAGIAVVSALALVLREQLQLVRIRRLKNHVVVCGLGRKGLLLSRSLRERGLRVVGLELDPGGERVESCRAAGAEVLIGDARDAEMLRRAGVRRASHLIAVCGDDGTNADTAASSRILVSDRRGGPLTCIAHIYDPDLCNLLRAQELRGGSEESFTLEFFNVFEAGARALLNRYPPFPERPEPGSSPHLLVVGLGRLGSSAVVQAARNWSFERGADERLPVTIVDRQGREKTRSLCVRYPQLARLCDIEAWDMAVESPEFQQGTFLPAQGERPDVTAAYVCLDDDSRGLSAALALGHLDGLAGGIVVRTVQAAGLASLLVGRQGAERRFENLHAFPLLDRTCSSELLFGGLYETFARANHDDYIRMQEEAGNTPETKPAMAPWDELDEGFKRSSRAQAHHLGEKLEAVRCDVIPLTDWDAQTYRFGDEEVELLAEMEHDRWMEERLATAWTLGPGPGTDAEKRTSPWLIPWNELPNDVQEWDRRAVRRIPLILARAGFQIVPLGQSEQRERSAGESAAGERSAIGSGRS